MWWLLPLAAAASDVDHEAVGEAFLLEHAARPGVTVRAALQPLVLRLCSIFLARLFANEFSGIQGDFVDL